MGGFVIAAAFFLTLGSVLKKYWDTILNWLNTTVANAIENVLGLGARERFFKAVSVADKFFSTKQGRSVAMNNSTLYVTKAGGLYDVFDVECETPAEELGEEYLKQLRKSDNVLTIPYKH